MATVDSDGNPHCVAIGFAKVVADDKILFTDNFLIETVKNIAHNSNICLTVWNINWKKDTEGYEIKGQAEYFQKGEWFEMVKKMKENKGLACKAAVLLTVNRIKRLA